jgi:hypothetical protein
MSFFDDEPLPPEPQPRPPRRKRDRSRLKVQRLVIFLVVLFVIVFVLALAVRACQRHAKESAYREYFTDTASVINDSNDVGKRIGAILDNPTKYNRQELTAELDKLVADQTEITTRAQNIKPPDKLEDLHSIFALGMKVRQRGVEQVKAGLLAAIGKKKTKAMATKLAALSGYFTGPDVYYGELYQTQAQKIMADDGVTNVRVPSSDYFLKNPIFNAAAIEAALNRAAASTSQTGTHGVGLVSVVAKPDGVKLKAGQDTQVQSTPDLAFTVTIQNQGTVTESNVPVKLTFTAPGGSPQQLTGTVAAIGPGERQSVDIGGVTIPAEALAKTSTLKVVAGPVKGEKVLDNNQATYGIILQFE